MLCLRSFLRAYLFDDFEIEIKEEIFSKYKYASLDLAFTRGFQIGVIILSPKHKTQDIVWVNFLSHK